MSTIGHEFTPPPSGSGIRRATSLVAFTVIIPCYNEEQAITQTLDEIRRALAFGPDYEVIVVDDGSTDRTCEWAEQAAADDVRVRVVRHPRNRGYGASLKTGLRHARSEWIVITDADGTYPNDRIPDLLARTRAADMVVGSRTAPNSHYPWIRKIPKAFLRLYASWIASFSIPDLNSGLRAFRRSVALRFFRILPNGFSFTTTITLAMLTNDCVVEYMPISYEKRIGQSKIRPIRDTVNFFHLIARTGMYFAPLRVLLPMAAIFILLFLVSLSYDLFVLENLTEKTVLALVLGTNIGLVGLVADVISKRSVGMADVWAEPLEQDFQFRRPQRLAGQDADALDDSQSRAA